MKIFGLILLVLAIVCAVSAIEALAVMALWNYVLCAIFTSVPTISFWLALGVLVLLNFVGSFFKRAK